MVAVESWALRSLSRCWTHWLVDSDAISDFRVCLAPSVWMILYPGAAHGPAAWCPSQSSHCLLSLSRGQGQGPWCLAQHWALSVSTVSGGCCITKPRSAGSWALQRVGWARTAKTVEPCISCMKECGGQRDFPEMEAYSSEHRDALVSAYLCLAVRVPAITYIVWKGLAIFWHSNKCSFHSQRCLF